MRRASRRDHGSLEDKLQPLQNSSLTNRNSAGDPGKVLFSGNQMVDHPPQGSRYITITPSGISLVEPPTKTAMHLGRSPELLCSCATMVNRRFGQVPETSHILTYCLLSKRRLWVSQRHEDLELSLKANHYKRRTSNFPVFPVQKWFLSA